MQSLVDDRDREVVERRSEVPAHVAHFVQWQRQRREGPGHLQRLVHRRMLRRERPAAARVLAQQRGEAFPQRTERDVPQGERLLRRGDAELRQAVHEGLRRARLAHGDFDRERRCRNGAPGARAQARVDAPGSRRSVDDGVMHFRVQREPVARQSVDEPVAEQRPAAVEHRFVQVCHEAQQAFVRRAFGQHEMRDVVVGVVGGRLAEIRHAGAAEFRNVAERWRRLGLPVGRRRSRGRRAGGPSASRKAASRRRASGSPAFP